MDLIDRQALLRKLFPYEVVDKRNCAINAYAVEKAILDMPALNNTTVASETLVEIREALISNYKARAERIAKPNVDMADEFISYCEGKIAALRGIETFIEDLLQEVVGDDDD